MLLNKMEGTPKIVEAVNGTEHFVIQSLHVYL